MKLRDYREHTYAVCQAWLLGPSPKTKLRLIRNLQRWAMHTIRDGELNDYGYQGDVKGHIQYCSDRMNQGRAKAILRLLGDPK